MRTPICDELGIEFPIFAFSHCRDVVAAVTNAGGFGVLGALAFEPERLAVELDWLDEHVNGRPYGVDFAMPQVYVGKGGGDDATPEALSAMIPQEHRDFMTKVLDDAGIPPRPDELGGHVVKAAGLNVDAEGPSQVELCLSHPNVKMIVNALGPPPQYVIDRAHEAGVLVGALAGLPQHAERQVAMGVDVVVAQGTEAGRPLRRDLHDGAGAPDRRRGGRPGAGAGRGRHRRRPPDGRGHGPGRPGRVVRLDLAPHRGGRHVPRGHREPAGGDLPRLRALAGHDRQARPPAAHPLDRGMGAGRRAEATSDAVAGAALRRGRGPASPACTPRSSAATRPGRSSAASTRCDRPGRWCSRWSRAGSTPWARSTPSWPTTDAVSAPEILELVGFPAAPRCA